MPSTTLRQAAAAFQRAVKNFVNDGCPTMAAALAYYSLFSLPPLIVVVTGVATSIFDEATVRDEVILRAEEMFGAAGAEQVRTIVERAGKPMAGLGVATRSFGSEVITRSAAARAAATRGRARAPRDA